MNIIIHNGHGKTGSSSIQSSLNTNKVILNENKIFYVGLNFECSPYKKYDWQKPYGWPTLILLKQKELNTQLYEVIYNTIKKLIELGYETIIWSNESLFTAVSSIKSVLALLTEDHNVTAITYLRRHDRWIDSAYKQWGIKHKSYEGVVVPFSSWANKDISYAPLLKVWNGIERIQLKVINFDQTKDVCTAFFSMINVNNQSLQFNRSNESPTLEILFMYAMYNSLFEESVLPSQLEPLLKNYNLKDLKTGRLALKSIFPSQDELKAVLHKYNDDIDEVNEFLSESGQEGFNKEFVAKEGRKEVDSEDVTPILIHILNEQTKKIGQLSMMYQELKEKVDQIENN